MKSAYGKMWILYLLVCVAAIYAYPKQSHDHSVIHENPAQGLGPNDQANGQANIGESHVSLHHSTIITDGFDSTDPSRVDEESSTVANTTNDLLMQDMLAREQIMNDNSTSETVELDSFTDWLDDIHPQTQTTENFDTSTVSSVISDSVGNTDMITSTTERPIEMAVDDFKNWLNAENTDTIVEEDSTTVPAEMSTESTGEISMAPVDFFNWMNSIRPTKTVSADGSIAGTSKPEVSTGKPGEFADWLNKMMSANPNANIHMTNINAFRLWINGVQTGKPSAKNVEHFRRWMNKLQPSTPSTSPKEGSVQHRRAGVSGMEQTHDSRPSSIQSSEIIDAKPHLSTQKLVIVVSIVFGTLVFFSIVITFCYFCQRDSDNSITEKVDPSLQTDTVDEVKKAPPVVNVISADDDLNMFMGIPANNDIWKELQALPTNASSVFSDSENTVRL